MKHKKLKTMNIKNIQTVSILAVILFVSSCTKDFLDINEDPNNPTDVNYNLVLTNAELHITTSLSMSGGGLSSFLSVFTHQVVQRRESNKYALTGSAYPIGEAWDHLYSGGLEDLSFVIQKGTENEDMIYVGIAKILRAYAFSQIVDVWGDVPFSQANNSVDYYYPAFDNDETIYPGIISLIDEGIANLQDQSAENTLVPHNDDIIYGGDVTSWITFAKTLKLKLYNQIRLYQDVSSEVQSILDEGDIINNQGDDFEIWYNNSVTPENRNPGYYNEYNSEGMEFYISPWLYEIMMGYSTNPNLPGIADPRVPYYWFRQLGPGDEAQNPTEYRDGGFISIYFGSDGPNRDQAQSVSATVLGLYPIGGRYDDDNPIAISGNSGTGVAPLRLLTYYSTLFTRAELALTGVSNENPRQLLENGINAAFNKVNQIATVDGSPTISSGDIDTYRNAVLAIYDAANNAGKLEIIMTQKWIASIGYAIDQYTDYRRTGYPVLFNPNTMPSTPPEGDPVLTSVSRGYQNSIEWPSAELELNMNAPESQKLVSTNNAKLFWDID